MPKIVDHNEIRKDIALKAASIFIASGYKNIGMRQLCEQLGMSKSAVYHYYKSKDELFKAATEAMIHDDELILTGRPFATNATTKQRIENFIAIFDQLAPRFFKEIQLVINYIEVIGEENVAGDPCMQLANRKYLALLTKYVSPKNPCAFYTALLGLLNYQVISGKPLEKDDIIIMVTRLFHY